MARDMWRLSEKRLGNRRGIECAGSFGLSGARGDIWVYSETQYRAIVFRGEDEELVRFAPSELEYWCRMLDVPRDPLKQAEYANNFSRNSDEFQKRYAAISRKRRKV